MMMDNRGVVVRVACKLHNICIDDFGKRKPETLQRGFASDFSGESDYRVDDWIVPQYTDGTPVISQGYRSDLERCNHRDEWTRLIRLEGLKRPTYSKYSKTTIRM